MIVKSDAVLDSGSEARVRYSLDLSDRIRLLDCDGLVVGLESVVKGFAEAVVFTDEEVWVGCLRLNENLDFDVEAVRRSVRDFSIVLICL